MLSLTAETYRPKPTGSEVRFALHSNAPKKDRIISYDFLMVFSFWCQNIICPVSAHSQGQSGRGSGVGSRPVSGERAGGRAGGRPSEGISAWDSSRLLVPTGATPSCHQPSGTHLLVLLRHQMFHAELNRYEISQSKSDLFFLSDLSNVGVYIYIRLPCIGSHVCECVCL